ncbi:UDP-N-acetylmuramate--L-alanine ligase [bacterium]|nr:UDP-N-acetylmuramate--L-alanine ligase [bacterium]OIO89489.1 MAG: UDP-N-acetylmuramate--L-alanine ligase [Anaerolineae bacterium CG2_30_58_95]PIW18371.1 MAG: UDP-N-acetylmuramate--L-alanine ligase [Anaerolineae bacterium CG17_big_fil_post_rev_8_21_14_2_50_57_27]PIX46793.1 MAG: UDP-N-acetylmuramate--L-alanine ligase [Anaerolineae bacterium CG_4_8_14_3_um_filter_59_70]PJH74931.1 MAG: UDP-N-acetylmuramate--L-alanine ligase [Anaerolineae bacterium CG_4_9_14_0_8_um_filter_58_9]
MEHIHLIGIGGSGLSAIARLLKEMGYAVSGSDRAETPFLPDLRSAGVTISLGHRPGNVRGADVVVRSSAIPDDNPEVVAARAAGIPVLKRADYLGRLMEGKTGIAVAGTHGKTTTTAMLAWLLTALGQEPSFIVGGVLRNLGVNARAGKGKTFVIEADEYDRMFLGLKPVIEVVTNVEHDHPDCYPTPADFQAAFVEFVKLLPADGVLVACAEDPGAQRLLNEAKRLGKKTVAYGKSDRSSVISDQWALAKNVKANESGGFTFEAIVTPHSSLVTRHSSLVTRHSPLVTLQVPGRHNVLNALAALTVASLLGLSLEDGAQALGQFTGTGRRFEVRGEANGIVVIDDYAHHPTEIRATLAAARSRYAGCRIWAVWQPHTYSRTRTLFNQFTHAFNDADQVIVTEIYAAREPIQDYSAAQVVQAMPHPSAQFIPDLPAVSDYLVSHLRPGDVLLVLSAGDADLVSTQVLADLQTSEVRYA